MNEDEGAHVEALTDDDRRRAQEVGATLAPGPAQLRTIRTAFTRSATTRSRTPARPGGDGPGAQAELRPLILLPWTSLTLEQVRSELSGLHFTKESLTEQERRILYLAEGLLRLVDELS